jgi:hypothetical protein
VRSLWTRGVLAFVNASLKSDWKVDPAVVRCTSMTTVPGRVAAPPACCGRAGIYLAAWDEGLAETREGRARIPPHPVGVSDRMQIISSGW